MSYVNFGNYSISGSNPLSNDYVQIDTLLAPIIVALNQKGYKTVSCCQGHLEENSSDDGYHCTPTYIRFEPWVKLPSLPDGRWEYMENTNSILFDNDKYCEDIHIDYYMFIVFITAVCMKTYTWADKLDLYQPSTEYAQLRTLFKKVKLTFAEDGTIRNEINQAQIVTPEQNERITMQLKKISLNVYAFLSFYYNKTRNLYNTEMYYESLKSYCRRHILDTDHNIIDRIHRLYSYNY